MSIMIVSENLGMVERRAKEKERRGECRSRLRRGEERAQKKKIGREEKMRGEQNKLPTQVSL